MNVTGPYWWYTNIGSGYGLVTSGNEPLPESMLTRIYVTKTPLSHNELISIVIKMNESRFQVPWWFKCRNTLNATSVRMFNKVLISNNVNYCDEFHTDTQKVCITKLWHQKKTCDWGEWYGVSSDYDCLFIQKYGWPGKHKLLSLVACYN